LFIIGVTRAGGSLAGVASDAGGMDCWIVIAAANYKILPAGPIGLRGKAVST